MYMKKYPCVYMRGGTSKAVFFHEKGALRALAAAVGAKNQNVHQNPLALARVNVRGPCVPRTSS